MSRFGDLMRGKTHTSHQPVQPKKMNTPEEPIQPEDSVNEEEAVVVEDNTWRNLILFDN